MGTRDLPSGTVTFVFTDVEGSTRLLHALGPDRYAAALATHRRAVRAAAAAHGGIEVDTQGDAFFLAFPTAPGALAASREATDALADGPIRIRIGLHTGTPLVADEGYVGPDVHRGARIAAAGHGGQILVSAATAALLDGTELRDLGSHRLKDLTAPARIFQADPDEHPPLKTLHQTNLPIPATPFLGRAAELAELAALLRRDEVRLLTLTGPGGTGKTRLALQAAADAADAFPGGVWWVPLAPLRDPALVLESAAKALGASGDLAQHIGDRRLLLLLDNFEHLMEAIGEVGRLLSQCPSLRVLVTSRAILDLAGERRYRVQPLPIGEAVALFTERSGSPATDEVERLCLRLDALPLAVELAAARARHLTPGQLLERLNRRLDLFRGPRDSDPRHATLRATIEWSEQLLQSSERQLFVRLAVFRGGWTVDAMEHVVDGDLDDLAALADGSLVVHDGERFSMLETIREFAEERFLASDDADAIRRRHLDYYTEMAEQWYEHRNAAPAGLLLPVEPETDNVRQALDFAATLDGPEEQRLAGAVALFWMRHGYGTDALTRLRAAVARRDARDEWSARSIMHLGGYLDDPRVVREARDIFAELGDRNGQAEALETLGWVHDAIGDYVSAQAAYEESLAVCSSIAAREADALGARAGLCHVLVAQGDPTAARHHAEDLLAGARRVKSPLMEELALHFMADCDLIAGRYADAEVAYLRALRFARDAGLVGRAVDEVIGVAMSIAGQGRDVDGVRLSAAAHTKQVAIGKGSDFWWDRMQQSLLDPARERLGERAEAAESQGRTASFDEVVGELLGAEAV